MVMAADGHAYTRLDSCVGFITVSADNNGE
jgi:hypothetical protein